MKKTFVSVYTFCFLFLLACSSQPQVEPGKVYYHLTLKSDSSLSYALYIPKNKNASNLAFIFFDPHAGGNLPVNMYKNLAEEFGIILIGNNNSSNNTDFNLISTNFSTLLDFLKKEYSLDEKNISLWGFSGGAKAAMNNAGLNNHIAYCIYGGSVMDQQNNNTELLGFNGKQDMNYTDLLSFGTQQQNNPKHFQIEFTGKHAWPDTATAKDGFRWFLLMKMQHKELAKSLVFIGNVASAYKKEAAQQLAAKKYLDAFQTCNKAMHFLHGLTDLNYFSSTQQSLMQNPGLKTQVQNLQSTFQKESQLKYQYQTDFIAKDTIYWKKTIDDLWMKSKIDKTGMYDRLLGFLSLASYSYANRAFSQNQMSALAQILFIYQHSDPTNPEQAFMRARLYVLQGENDKARAALKEAVQLGIDQSRIADDILLKNLN